jgi:urease accessory protein
LKAEGSLSLRFERSGNRTILSRSAQRPPLRVVRAFDLPGGEALAHLHNVSGGLLGGDRLSMAVELGPGASVQLTTTGATRIYRGDAASAQSNSITVEEGGLLAYVPDAIIPFGGSRYAQRTTVDLAAGAGLFWWDIFAPGREARGEVFAYDMLESHLEIRACGCPVAIESVRLEPRARPLTSPARLGAFRYWATFYICRAGLDPSRWKRLEAQLSAMAADWTRAGESVWAVSALVRHGVGVRVLSLGGLDIPAGLMAFWKAASMELDGREPVALRKVN